MIKTVFGKAKYPFTPELEYQAVLDAAATLGYSLPTRKEMYHQNEMVKALKLNGLWSKLDQIYNFYHSANSFHFSTINWIHPSFVMTNTGIVSYVWEKKQGYNALSGSPHFIGTYNAQTQIGNFQLGNASFGWVYGNMGTTDGGVSILDSYNPAGMCKNRDWAPNRQYFQQGGGYTHGISAVLPTVGNIRISTRTVSNNKFFDNGVKIRDGAITYQGSGTAAPSTNVDHAFSLGTKGNPSCTIRFAFTGGNLSEAECVMMTTIWDNYKNSI